ncbi:uridine kinase [Xanthovirga aplysinae]|uniref:uridine kinase n=1 Tax=Xanthovirga aplysinae TaxID=2529853 RepID=UPI0012BC1A35|nr:uridine kinase [Xanthovirga aplysinae]MTI32409.1 uridine kinase [Xanthovirga aplysinae]
MIKPYIVGITGGSASGKTLFLNKLVEQFNQDEVCLLSQDNYYHPLEKQLVDENGVYNFDTPSSIEFSDLVRDIQQLKEGNSLFRKEYTFENFDKEAQVLKLSAAPIIIVEGIFVFYYPEVAEQLDLKVFIETKEHVKLKRRIIRDNAERGYDLEEVLYRYEKHVAPTYEKYIKPYKEEADLIIPNNVCFDSGLEVLVSHLKTKLKKQIVPII